MIIGHMANVQLAVAGDETTQVILSVPGVQGPAGSNLPPSGTTNQVLYKQSSTNYDTAWSLVTSAMITDGTIVNGDINDSAAIAGTKISPNFGSQNAVTTGTSTAASFIPTSNTAPANGLYLPSANNVAISTGGSGRLFVDASGNVGVGVSPSAIFEAAGSEPVFGLNHHVTQYLTSTKAYNATPGGGIALRYKYNSANDYTYGAGISFEKDNTVDGDFGSHITIQTRPNDGSATERLRITSAGLVGVGTSTPESYKDEAEQLVVSKAGNCGITVASATNGVGALYFADGTSGSDASRGGLYYSHIDNSMQLLADGSARVYITSGGLVGIGASLPSQKLHIGGTNPGDSLIRQDATTGGTNWEIGEREAGKYQWWEDDNDQVRMTLTSQGRLGIGTTDPQGQCESATAGDTYCFVANNTFGGTLQKYLSLNSGSTQLGNISRLNSGNDIAFNATYGAVAFGTGSSGTATEKCRIDSSGRLLVGTSSTSATSTAVFASRSDGAAAPLLALHTTESTVTNGANFATLSFGNTATTGTNAAAFIQGQRDGGTWTNNSSMPGRLVFSTTADGVSSPTERMAIRNNGQILSYNDNVAGSISLNLRSGVGASSGSFFLIGSHSATGVLSGSVTDSIYIFTNGNVVNINNSYGPLSSDQRLKQDITDANSQWDDIKNIRITNFRYKNDPAGPLHLGPIAQELEQVSPGLITRRPASEDEIADPSNSLVDGDEVLSFKASILYMKAVKALQEAMERIEQLEQRLADAGIN